MPCWLTGLSASPMSRATYLSRTISTCCSVARASTRSITVSTPKGSRLICRSKQPTCSRPSATLSMSLELLSRTSSSATRWPTRSKEELATTSSVVMKATTFYSAVPESTGCSKPVTPTSRSRTRASRSQPRASLQPRVIRFPVLSELSSPEEPTPTGSMRARSRAAAESYSMVAR